MTSPPTVVHVGLPKTATTFLQNVVFPQKSGVSYWGRTSKTGPIDELADKICKLDPISQDGNELITLRECCRSAYGQQGGPVLLSIEDFSTVRTSLLIGHVLGERLCDRATIAHRLHGLFPAARIVVTIRRHLDIVESFYRYVLQRNHRFVPPADWFRQNSRPGGMLDTFDMARLVEAYDRIFGRENVLVLPYEWLQTDPGRFFNELFQFCGAPMSNRELADFVQAATTQRVNARGDERAIETYLVRRSRLGRQLGFLPDPVLRVLFDAAGNREKWELETANLVDELSKRYTADSRRLKAARPGLELDVLGY